MDRSTKKSMSKYGSIKTGIYDSKREAARAAYLRLMLKAGKIFQFSEQVRYEIIPKQIKENGTVERACHYVADFVYSLSDGSVVVEDCKGMRLPLYVVKRKLMLRVYGITIVET